jgi:hypothetical protein
MINLRLPVGVSSRRTNFCSCWQREIRPGHRLQRTASSCLVPDADWRNRRGSWDAARVKHTQKLRLSWRWSARNFVLQWCITQRASENGGRQMQRFEVGTIQRTAATDTGTAEVAGCTGSMTGPAAVLPRSYIKWGRGGRQRQTKCRRLNCLNIMPANRQWRAGTKQRRNRTRK